MHKNNLKNTTPSKIQKTRAKKRFHILFTEEEWEIIQKESLKQGISIAELIRKAIFSDLKKVTTLEKIQALENLTQISPT